GLRVDVEGSATVLPWDRVSAFGPDAITVAAADVLRAPADPAEAAAATRTWTRSASSRSRRPATASAPSPTSTSTPVPASCAPSSPRSTNCPRPSSSASARSRWSSGRLGGRLLQIVGGLARPGAGDLLDALRAAALHGGLHHRVDDAL